MNLRSLVQKIADRLNLHNSVCQTFVEMVLSMIDQNNVQHHALIHLFTTQGTIESKLERVRRFFAEQKILAIGFAQAVITSIWGENIPKMHVILDRTNWKFGKQDINYLVLAVRIGKLVFPLFWTLLDHKGNSDTQARIDLLNKFKEAFGLDKILSFSADREFIGGDWIAYLLENKIPFVIRIKLNQLASWNGCKKSLRDYFSHLSHEETLVLQGLIEDASVRIACKKINGDYLILLSNLNNNDAIFKTYRKRWDIERLFRNMKTQGFNLENTHMKDLERLSKLMCLVAIGILVAGISGLLEECAYKQTVRSPLYSLFTMGLRVLKLNILGFSFDGPLIIAQKSEG